MTLQAQIAAGFARLAQAINAAAAHTWTDYATRWTVAPTQAGAATAPVSGTVYAYTLGGVTRYRLVPTAYSAAEDAFYSAFSGGACTGLLARRSQS